MSMVWQTLGSKAAKEQKKSLKVTTLWRYTNLFIIIIITSNLCGSVVAADFAR